MTDKVENNQFIPFMGDRIIRIRGAVSADDGFTDVAGGVASTEIANGSISAAKLATDAVETLKIKDSNVTYAKVQNVSATDKVLGRSTASAGAVEEIPCTAAGRAILDDADAPAQRTTLGLGALAVKATVAVGDIDSDAVETLKIKNANVTLGKLAAGITPSHVVKFAGTITWSGSGAALDTTISGVAATDIVQVSFRVAPTQAATFVSAIPSTDHLIITLSAANTSNDAQIDYVVVRAAA